MRPAVGQGNARAERPRDEPARAPRRQQVLPRAVDGRPQLRRHARAGERVRGAQVDLGLHARAAVGPAKYASGAQLPARSHAFWTLGAVALLQPRM